MSSPAPNLMPLSSHLHLGAGLSHPLAPPPWPSRLQQELQELGRKQAQAVAREGQEGTLALSGSNQQPAH